MKQSSLNLNLSNRATRKQAFLDEMDRVVPWAALVELIAPYYPEGRNGWPPLALETMLRVHFMQQWFTLSDPAMEESFFDIPAYREFAQLEEFARLPDESTILRFRHRLEQHKLAEQILSTVNELLTRKGLLLKVGTAVDATLIAAPARCIRARRAKQWYFGMKAHTGVGADSGLVHTARGSSGNVADITEANSLPHGQEQMVFAGAGYRGIEKRPDTSSNAKWHVARGLSKRRALNKENAADALLDKAEKLKAGVRAKVEHPCQMIKRQFGHVKVRYRGLKKSTAQLLTLFALSNLWMGRSKLMGFGV